jgi:hypothetical protein
MQADPAEYLQLDLRVHSFLADVELHDVWVAELDGGGPDRDIQDARRCFRPQTATTANAAVRLLFAIRAGLGRVFGWDRARDAWADEMYAKRLTDDERAASLVAPGADEGPFSVVYVLPYEALSEIRNATVHAFSCFALRPTSTGYRLYWAIYVKPIGRWTALYMRLIDPFRRIVVYPAVIGGIESTWRTTCCD